MNRTESNEQLKQHDWSLERWIVVLLSLLFLLPRIARGAQEPETTTLEKVSQAELLFKTATPGVYNVGTAVHSDVTIQVFGPVIRTTVRQTFRNDTGHCTETKYVYPLPENGAVDSLEMTIGSRHIVGEIHEREEARRQYEAAVQEGRKAALIEQLRPNVFTTSVASLLPNEEAVIEIQYQEVARFENGRYSLRFPMVVAPRYTPARVDPVAASAAILPIPESLPAKSSADPVSLTVDLQAGYSLRKIESTGYRVVTETLGNRHYRLAMDAKSVTAERDFELQWEPDLGSNPEATVLTEKLGSETYALVMVTPPMRAPQRVARETVFIIDSSGSMEGASMDQAKQSLLLALDDLRPEDRFNVIDFDSTARPLFADSQPAGPENIAQAKTFVAGMSADGGTEMLSALKLALPQALAAKSDYSGVRQVIFMTDGQVSNEQELFSWIHDNLGDSRLFTIGIGAAPNSHFMRNAARFGRGTFTYIGDVQEVKAKMGELFSKLDSPVMTGVAIDISDKTAESWPARIPDLYRGEPLVVTVRLQDPQAKIVLHGQLGSEAWQQELTLPAAGRAQGITRLWAREKIESLTDGLSQGRDPGAVRTAVVDMALHHHLVSEYTSLVAVDRSPQGFAGAICKPEEVPSQVDGSGGPEGSLPQTDTPAALLLVIGGLLIVTAVTARRFI